MAETLIQGVGFDNLRSRVLVREAGATMNVVAEDSNGTDWYFDVSGAMASDRAGLIRTDTMWKTLGRANAMHFAKVSPVVLLTSNPPESGSVGDTALRRCRPTIFDVVEMTDGRAKARLRRYAEAGWPTPALPGFWTAEELYGDEMRPGGPAGAAKRIPTATVGVDAPARSITGLTHRFETMIPSFDRSSRPIERLRRDGVIEQIKRLLSGLGGGCTSTEARGSWIDPFHEVVNEDVLRIEGYMASRIPDHVLREVVDLILVNLDQDAAAVVVDGEMLLYER
jgi:hypothetical protein